LLKNKKIFKESIWAFLGQFISIIALVLGIRLITEVVNPEHYGQYVIFSGIILLAFNVISGSIFQSFLRIIPEKDENRSILLSSKIIFVFFTISSIALTLSLLIDSYIFFLVFVFFAYLISEHFVGFYKVLMNINKEQKKYAFFQIFLSFMRPVFAVLLYLYFDNNFTSLLYGYISANLLIVFIFFGNKTLLDLKNSFRKKIKLNEFSEFLIYSKPLFFQKIFGWSLNNIDKYIIAFFFGTNTLGQYAPIVSLISMLYLTTSEAINITFRPYYFGYVAKKKINESKKILKMYGFVLLFASIIYIIIFSFFNQQIVNIVLGENFRSFYYLLPILSVGFTFLVFGYFFATICLAYKKTWLVFNIECAAAIMNVLILPLAVYKFGINGIPAALILTYFLHCTIAYYLSRGIDKNE